MPHLASPTVPLQIHQDTTNWNTVIIPHKTEIKLIKKIGESRNPVYLAHSEIHNSNYALKTFPCNKKGLPCTSFVNQSRFTDLTHPNIISVIDSDPCLKVNEHGLQSQVSYVLMDYACNGTFSEAMDKIIRAGREEKLIRTYFHQLIEGLEYLHQNKIAHLDLKPANLMLDENYKLKITDFDASYKEGDFMIISLGTKNFRAPEIKNKTIKKPYSADIYSAAIIAFIGLIGNHPFLEDVRIKGNNIEIMMQRHIKNFWATHQAYGSAEKVSEDFKNMFNRMVEYNPEDRASINEIKESKWYNGPVYESHELKNVMTHLMKKSH